MKTTYVPDSEPRFGSVEFTTYYAQTSLMPLIRKGIFDLGKTDYIELCCNEVLSQMYRYADRVLAKGIENDDQLTAYTGIVMRIMEHYAQAKWYGKHLDIPTIHVDFQHQGLTHLSLAYAEIANLQFFEFYV